MIKNIDAEMKLETMVTGNISTDDAKIIGITPA